MKVTVLLAGFAFFSSCFTTLKPTPYQMQNDYNHRTGEKNTFGLSFDSAKTDTHTVISSTFVGNTKTTKARAYSFATLGAIEYCHKRNKEMLNLGNKDSSFSTNHVGSTSTGGYYIGDRYVPGTTSVYSYSKNYPMFRVAFVCLEHLWSRDAEYDFKEVDAVLIKDIVKDFQGGVLVKKATSSSGKSALQVGDIILKSNGKRITRSSQFTLMLFDDKPIETLQIIRNKKIRQVKLTRNSLYPAIKIKNKASISVFCDDMEEEYDQNYDERDEEFGDKPTLPKICSQNQIDEDKI